MPDVDATLDPPETVETAPPGDGDGTQTDGEGGAASDVDEGAEGSQSTKPDGAASDTDTDGDDTGEGEGEGEGGTSEKKTAFKELLAKYDGDEEKLAEGVWNQGNSLAEINKRLKGVEENLAQALAPPEQDIQTLVDDDPYVKEATANLRSTDAKVKEAEQEQVRIIAEHGKLEKQVARLEGKLEAASPEDRDEIRSDLREAKSDRKDAHRQYRESKRDVDSLNRELRGYAQQFRDAEAKAKDLLERTRQSTQTKKEQETTLRSDFTDAVEAEAKKFGIPLDGQTFKVLHQSIKDRITGFLRTLPKGAPGINTVEAVEILMEEYVEAMALKSRFQKTSTRKRKAAGDKQGSGLKAPDTSGDKKGEWTADYVRKRAAQLMP